MIRSIPIRTACALFWVFLLLFATGSRAQQLASARIIGVVTDPSGKAIRNVTVTLTNLAQGTVRSLDTQEDGSFSFTTLEAAKYRLTVSSPAGFSPYQQYVTVNVGQDLSVPVRLAIASNQTKVEVVADTPPAVDTATSALGGVINARQISTLPLNGRNYLELSLLVPGNAPAPNFDPTKENTVVISTAGQVGRGGNVTIDGADNNDDAVGGSLVNIPEDAVQEFQIATNRFSAELGRSGSAVTNVVTKQGTNDLHGGVAMYERDKVLQGLPATYDPSIGSTPPFHRQQYAGDIGGPFKQDKAWWFVAMEDRQQLGADLVGVRDTTTQTIGRTFATAPLHDFLATTRLDWQASRRDRVGFRYSLQLEDDLSQSELDRALGTAAYRQTAENHLQGLVADWVHTFTPTLINRMSFADNNFLNITNPIVTGPQITYPNLDDGATYRIPQQTRQFRLQGDDTLTWSHLNHTLSFGGEVQSIDADFYLPVFIQGNIQAVEDFPDFDRNGDGKVDDNDLLFAVALQSSTPTKPLNLPDNDNYHVAGFAQDDWKALPNLVLNLGLRWEMDTNLNNLSWYSQRNPIVQSFYQGSRHREYNNWGPRIGFNYSVNPNLSIHGGYGIYYDRITLEIMSLEKGFDGRALALNVTAGNAVTNPDGTPVYLNPNGTFKPGAPEVLSSPFSGFLFAGAGSTGIDIIDNRLRNPMVQQFNLGVETQIHRSLTVKVDGVHNFGTRFIIGDPVGSVYNPQTGGPDEITNLASWVGTKYDALWISVRQLLGKYGEFDSAYTLAKAFNYANDDQIPFEYSPIDPNNLQREYGPPPNDQRHRLVMSGIANLPYKLQFSPVWTIASGVPMDILLPDGSERVPTMQRNAGGREFQNARQLNAFIATTNAAGGVYEASTNSYVILPQVSDHAHFNDSFNALDFRLSRAFHFGERWNLDLIGEAFNIFNVTNILGVSNLNYSGFANTLSPDNSNHGYSSSFGQPVSTAEASLDREVHGPSRLLQDSASDGARFAGGEGDGTTVDTGALENS
ncbi:TonB-dependent receptor [Alloacidobacterium sp.]|uniref:TonB-dependent receptor n=1 Tax=Alloacidobacterium sp. TaxID=2951999 RepID=UPI002D464ECB|nr:TonB-dependent receptor [Alloacidobacterium sp.]HYK35860.1 TonB-dependent receptor [Alloacidobacterium sp.]